MEAKERDARSLSRLTSAPSRSQTPYNAPDAALTGALFAFSSKPSTPVKHGSVIRLQDGALSAPKSVNNSNNYNTHYNYSNTRRGSDAPSSIHPASLTRSYTGSSTNSLSELDKENGTVGKQKLTSTSSSAASRSGTPIQTYRPTVRRSESLTAATLATARSQRTSPARAPAPTTTSRQLPALDSRALALQRRLNERMVARELDGIMDDNGHQRTDLTSIEPTKSLVKMFEQQSSSSSAETPSLTRQPSLAKGKPPPIVAPKPQRAVSVQSVSPELRRPDVPVKPKPATKTIKNGAKETAGPALAAREDAIEAPQTKPNIPPPRRTGTANKPTVNTDTASTSSPLPLSRFGLPAPRPASRGPSVSPLPRVLPSNPQRASPAPYKDTSLNMLSPHMTGDSLANAMVGANLAIKSTSPPKRSRTPPPLPPSRRKHHAHDAVFGHSRARSLSPQKKQPGRLLTTLRTGDTEEKEKNRKHHFRQPNKHHEGTRERWRDHVSDVERKRYEGVWAANKGLYISSPSQADEVLNIVARDIWSRSRLPAERLAKVWDLVAMDENSDGGGVKRRRTLTREQFVVGMWLIDQILKGRNLPHNVNASVWTSVRLMGVKVRLEGKGKDGRKLERGTAW